VNESTWSVVFLGIIAVATLAIAIVQIGILIAAGRTARRIGQFVDEAERELKPIIVHLNAITRDASKAAALAVGQIERLDQMWNQVGGKVEQTLSSATSILLGPARQGRALLIGFQAAMAALRHFRSQRSPANGKEEEDGLFI
jgi:predicted PurR-regulated permease PerM